MHARWYIYLLTEIVSPNEMMVVKEWRGSEENALSCRYEREIIRDITNTYLVGSGEKLVEARVEVI